MVFYSFYNRNVVMSGYTEDSLYHGSYIVRVSFLNDLTPWMKEEYAYVSKEDKERLIQLSLSKRDLRFTSLSYVYMRL